MVDYLASKEKAEALARENPGRVFAFHADVTDKEQVERLFREAEDAAGRPIDSVVNNALADFSFNGDLRPKADDITWDSFDWQLKGTLEGALNVIQTALPGFEKAGSGRIVNIGTNLVQNPVVPYHDYTAAKAALMALTRTFAAGPRSKGRSREYDFGWPSAHYGREFGHAGSCVRSDRAADASWQGDQPRGIRRRCDPVPEPFV